MKTTLIAGLLLAASVSTAEAGVAYRNVASLVAPGPRGGEIIVALDIKCQGGGHFTMQTNRYQNQSYRGCAFREYGHLVIRWNDGAVVRYAMNDFTRSTSWMNVY